MEKFISAGGCALRISDSGAPRHPEEQDPEGATAVLLHGYLESLNVWEDFSKLLSPHIRVIAIDLPGHGISEVKGEAHTMEFLADTVRSVLEALGVTKCTLIGHSMGGYAALEFLRKYPEMLTGLILLHSHPNPDSEEKRRDREREIAVVAAGKKDLLANTVARGFAPENRARFHAAIDELKDQVFLTEDEGIAALLRGMAQRGDTNQTLSQSAVPHMFIFGRKDEYIAPEAAEQIIKLHPEATVAWLENSGHMGFVEQPREAAEAILSFCRGLRRE